MCEWWVWFVLRREVPQRGGDEQDERDGGAAAGPGGLAAGPAGRSRGAGGKAGQQRLRRGECHAETGLKESEEVAQQGLLLGRSSVGQGGSRSRGTSLDASGGSASSMASAAAGELPSTCTAQFKAHTGDVNDLAYSPTGGFFATAGTGGGRSGRRGHTDGSAALFTDGGLPRACASRQRRAGACVARHVGQAGDDAAWRRRAHAVRGPGRRPGRGR